MAQSSDDLVVKLRADLRLLQAGLRQAVKEVDAAGKDMEKKLSPTMKRVQAGLKLGATAAAAGIVGLGVAAAGAGAALAVLFKRALDTADGLAKMSDKTGFSVEEIQRLRYAATQAGVSQDALETSLGKFVKTLG